MLGMLMSAGLDFLADMVKDKGEQVVNEVVKKTTGIDLTKTKTLSKEDITKLRANEKEILNMVLKDKQNARNMAVELANSNGSWLVKNTGSIIGLFVTISSFVLFALLLSGKLDINNSNVALIAGYAGGYISTILSFYFGSSKTEADRIK